MKELIRFTLVRKYTNKTTIVFNVLLFVILGLLFNVDFLVKGISKQVDEVVLDYTALDKVSDLLNMEHDSFKYVVKGDDSKKEALLYYEDGWYLRSEGEVSEEMINVVENDVREVLLTDYYRKADLKTRKYIDDFNNIVVEKVETVEDGDNNAAWIIISLVFFLLLTYGNSVSNELIYEKATRTLGLSLTSVTVNEHFFAKIITGYLTIMAQMAIGIVEGLIWIVIRYLTDEFNGLNEWLNEYLLKSSQETTIELSGHMLAVMGLLILGGLLTIQVITLIITSHFSNSEDASGLQGPMYLGLMICYYALLVFGDTAFFTSTVAEVLSLCPIISMVFMPCRIIINDINLWQITISLLLSFSFFGLLTATMLPVYKRNLMHN